MADLVTLQNNANQYMTNPRARNAYDDKAFNASELKAIESELSDALCSGNNKACEAINELYQAAKVSYGQTTSPLSRFLSNLEALFRGR